MMNAQALLNTWLKSNCLELASWPKAPAFTYRLDQKPSLTCFDDRAIVKTVFDFLDSIQAGGLRTVLGSGLGGYQHLTGPDHIVYELVHYPSIKYFEFRFCPVSMFMAYEKLLICPDKPFLLSVSDMCDGSEVYGLRSLVALQPITLDDAYMDFLKGSDTPFKSLGFAHWLLDKGLAKRLPTTSFTICDGELR